MAKLIFSFIKVSIPSFPFHGTRCGCHTSVWTASKGRWINMSLKIACALAACLASTAMLAQDNLDLKGPHSADTEDGRISK